MTAWRLAELLDAVWLYFPSAPDGRFARFIENDPRRTCIRQTRDALRLAWLMISGGKR